MTLLLKDLRWLPVWQQLYFVLVLWVLSAWRDVLQSIISHLRSLEDPPSRLWLAAKGLFNIERPLRDGFHGPTQARASLWLFFFPFLLTFVFVLRFHCHVFGFPPVFLHFVIWHWLWKAPRGWANKVCMYM